MKEESGLPFSSQTENAHTCGHDLHTAMLLSAIEELIQRKSEIHGNIKCMFQPAEEILAGARTMIEAGILENPKVDSAFAIHTGLKGPVGSYQVALGTMATSCDNFRIDIQGKGSHGAYLEEAFDPIAAGVSIYQQMSQLIAREVNPNQVATLTFGQFTAGNSSNVIPDKAMMQGTLRTYDESVRSTLKERMNQIVSAIESITRCHIKLDFFSGTVSLTNDPELTQEVIKILEETQPELVCNFGEKMMASEDFAEISRRVPLTYLMMNCQVPSNPYTHHHPKVEFDETLLPLGMKAFVEIALRLIK